MGLDWTKTIKRALKDERIPMSSIHDLFKNLKADPEPFRILIKGKYNNKTLRCAVFFIVLIGNERKHSGPPFPDQIYFQILFLFWW